MIETNSFNQMQNFPKNSRTIAWSICCSTVRISPQVQMAWNGTAQNDSGNAIPVNFEPFDAAYKALSEKLRPQVYTYGFLK